MDNKFSDSWQSRAVVVVFVDLVAMVVVNFISLWVRFDFEFMSIPREYLNHSVKFMPVCMLATLAVYVYFKLYQIVWRFAGAAEVTHAIMAYIVLAPIYYCERIVINNMYTSMGGIGIYLPRSYYVICYFLNLIACIGIRLSYRFMRSWYHNMTLRNDENIEKVMIIGGGQASRMIIKDIAISLSNVLPVCIIDDNPSKKNTSLEGIPIIGGRYEIPEAVIEYKIDQIIYAIPSASPESRREILNICTETGVKVKALPSITQILNDEVSVSRLRDVEIKDLLGREEIKVNNSEIMDDISGKVVMVTGGGGSIGSELCRQIAAAGPKQLIVYEIYENNAYAIEQELRRKYTHLDLKVLIGSVRNTNRVNWVLETYRPQLVYHAAAHKHVPLMEESPNEAIKNNPIGTYKMGVASAEHGVERFLLISTDKAVNPTNIMGASKRLCEMVVQMLNRRYENTDFVAVRFGNVLGSNGSVIPLFKEQIKNGGPVTVTDRNIIRYFMTIPEAVSLVLQAGYYAKGGEIFVLDMGEPVRIDDMARNLIRLSGYKPDIDIKIVYTGLRPGEKLFEELLMDEEGMQATDNKLIFIGKPIEMDDEVFAKQLHELNIASKKEASNIKEMVAEVVPTYHMRK